MTGFGKTTYDDDDGLPFFCFYHVSLSGVQCVQDHPSSRGSVRGDGVLTAYRLHLLFFFVF